MTVPIDPTPITESSAVMAATKIDAIAVQFRAVLETLQTIVPDLLTFDARQIKRIMASAKFGVQSIVPTITVVTTVPRAKDRNLFNVQGGQLAIQFRDQIVPLAMQLVKFADDIQFTSDNMLAVSAVEALQTYRWAQHAARQPDGAELHSYVADMSRAVKKTMNHRKPVASPAAPAPPAGTPPMPPGAQGFLAPNLGQGKSTEPEDIADRFDQALRDAAGDQDLD
jgi:hypothetical protein